MGRKSPTELPWMDTRPGAIIEIHPSNFIPMGRRPSVSMDEWNQAYATCIYRSMDRGTKESRSLVVPSVRWECAGFWTVCIGLYVLAYMTWGM